MLMFIPSFHRIYPISFLFSPKVAYDTLSWSMTSSRLVEFYLWSSPLTRKLTGGMSKDRNHRPIKLPKPIMIVDTIETEHIEKNVVKHIKPTRDMASYTIQG